MAAVPSRAPRPPPPVRAPAPRPRPEAADAREGAAPERKADGTQAIRRAAGILRFIASDPERGVGLREIAAATGLSRSTAHRILRCLLEEGLAAQSTDGRRYAIGDVTAELGLAAKNRKSAVLDWRGALEQVAGETEATAYLMARSGSECVCLDKVEGRTVVRVIPVEVGQRRPLGVGAGATALLASLPPEEGEGTIRAVAPHLAAHSRLTPEAVRENVRRARETGFAESRGSVATGVYGLGLALPAERGSAQLALSLAAHESQASEANVAAWKRCMLGAVQARRGRSPAP